MHSCQYRYVQCLVLCIGNISNVEVLTEDFNAGNLTLTIEAVDVEEVSATVMFDFVLIGQCMLVKKLQHPLICSFQPFSEVQFIVQCGLSSTSPSGPLRVSCVAIGGEADIVECNYDNGELVEACKCVSVQFHLHHLISLHTF